MKFDYFNKQQLISFLIVLWGFATVLGAYSQGMTDFKVYLPGLVLVVLGFWLFFNPDDELWNNEN